MTAFARQIELWDWAERQACAWFPWEPTDKGDPRCRRLADRHYTRQAPGHAMWTRPGYNAALYCSADRSQGVWCWWRPKWEAGQERRDGLRVLECTIFRLEGSGWLASDLIRGAVAAIGCERVRRALRLDAAGKIDALLTGVNARATARCRSRSALPGACFRHAGWRDFEHAPGRAETLEHLARGHAGAERRTDPGGLLAREGSAHAVDLRERPPRGHTVDDPPARYRMAAAPIKYLRDGVQPWRQDFAGDNRDQRSFAAWSALWLGEALRAARPGAVCAIFTDWRQLPSTTDAVQAGGWIWRGVVVWDKTEGGSRPQLGRPRQQAEFVVWGSAGALRERDELGVLPGILRPALDRTDRHHLAAKPVGLMRELARLCVPGGVILDPFAGSASTGCGALLEGRRFVGVEIDRHWHDVATRRLEAEEAQTTLGAERLGQQSLFAAGRR